MVKFLILFIFLTSMFDLYLTFKYCEVIDELNPIGKWIMGYGINVFAVCKIIGTFLACVIMILLYNTNKRIGMMVASGVALFQLGLLIFLLS